MSNVSGPEDADSNYTYSSSAWGDLLTGYNGTTINYDDIGNPTNWRNARIMMWDGKQLTAFTRDALNHSLSFSYNADGIRTSKSNSDRINGQQVNDTHDYILDGTNIVRELITHTVGTGSSATTTTKTLYYLYDASGSVVGLIYNNSPYYFQKNIQGDIIRICNAGGVTVVEYTYDAWGKILSVTGTLASTLGQDNPFRYRGYYYDTETGFYYLQTRYYDPEVGRFLNADCMIGANGDIPGYNMFAYCSNNPVIGYDPLGTWDWGTFLGGVTLIVVAVVAVAAAAPILTCASACAAIQIVASMTVVSAVATGINGLAEVVEGITDYNPIKEEVFGGDESAYYSYRDTMASLTQTLTMVCIGYVTYKDFDVCFQEGTLISTDEGQIPIEEVTVGTFVWATNEETGEKELKEVVRLFRNETDEWIHLTVDGEEIVCTPEHPFYVPGDGWTAACDLDIGDCLTTVTDEYIAIEQIWYEFLDSPETTYNFEVEGFHTYYVGENSYLVHNKCIVNDKGVKVSVRTSNEHGLPHAHVSGQGENTTVGLDMKPMRGHPALSKKQMRVIEKHWEEIENGIKTFFPSTH